MCGLGHPHSRMRGPSYGPGIGIEGDSFSLGFSSPHASTSWCRTPRNPRITHSDLAFRSLGSQGDQIRRIGPIFVTFYIVTHVKYKPLFVLFPLVPQKLGALLAPVMCYLPVVKEGFKKLLL